MCTGCGVDVDTCTDDLGTLWSYREAASGLFFAACDSGLMNGIVADGICAI